MGRTYEELGPFKGSRAARAPLKVDGPGSELDDERAQNRSPVPVLSLLSPSRVIFTVYADLSPFVRITSHGPPTRLKPESSTKWANFLALERRVNLVSNCCDNRSSYYFGLYRWYPEVQRVLANPVRAGGSTRGKPLMRWILSFTRFGSETVFKGRDITSPQPIHFDRWSYFSSIYK